MFPLKSWLEKKMNKFRDENFKLSNFSTPLILNKRYDVTVKAVHGNNHVWFR